MRFCINYKAVWQNSNYYYMYNPNTGEHFYTRHTNERDSLIRSGWNYEGVAWTFADSGKSVYRLYNDKEHFWTSTMRVGKR